MLDAEENSHSIGIQCDVKDVPIVKFKDVSTETDAHLVLCGQESRDVSVQTEINFLEDQKSFRNSEAACPSFVFEAGDVVPCSEIPQDTRDIPKDLFLPFDNNSKKDEYADQNVEHNVLNEEYPYISSRLQENWTNLPNSECDRLVREDSSESPCDTANERIGDVILLCRAKENENLIGDTALKCSILEERNVKKIGEENDVKYNGDNIIQNGDGKRDGKILNLDSPDRKSLLEENSSESCNTADEHKYELYSEINCKKFIWDAALNCNPLEERSQKEREDDVEVHSNIDSVQNTEVKSENHFLQICRSSERNEVNESTLCSEIYNTPLSKDELIEQSMLHELPPSKGMSQEEKLTVNSDSSEISEMSALQNGTCTNYKVISSNNSEMPKLEQRESFSGLSPTRLSLQKRQHQTARKCAASLAKRYMTRNKNLDLNKTSFLERSLRKRTLNKVNFRDPFPKRLIVRITPLVKEEKFKSMVHSWYENTAERMYFDHSSFCLTEQRCSRSVSGESHQSENLSRNESEKCIRSAVKLNKASCERRNSFDLVGAEHKLCDTEVDNNSESILDLRECNNEVAIETGPLKLNGQCDGTGTQREVIFETSNVIEDVSKPQRKCSLHADLQLQTNLGNTCSKDVRESAPIETSSLKGCNVNLDPHREVSLETTHKNRDVSFPHREGILETTCMKDVHESVQKPIEKSLLGGCNYNGEPQCKVNLQINNGDDNFDLQRKGNLKTTSAKEFCVDTPIETSSLEHLKDNTDPLREVNPETTSKLKNVAHSTPIDSSILPHKDKHEQDEKVNQKTKFTEVVDDTKASVLLTKASSKVNDPDFKSVSQKSGTVKSSKYPNLRERKEYELQCNLQSEEYLLMTGNGNGNSKILNENHNYNVNEASNETDKSNPQDNLQSQENCFGGKLTLMEVDEKIHSEIPNDKNSVEFRVNSYAYDMKDNMSDEELYGTENISKPFQQPKERVFESSNNTLSLKDSRDRPKLNPKKTCEICGISFKYRSQFVGHMRGHKKRKHQCCTYCFKPFRNYSLLLDHMKYHNKISKHTCSYCKEDFVTHQKLVSHFIKCSETKKTQQDTNVSEEEKSSVETSRNVHHEGTVKFTSQNVLTCTVCQATNTHPKTFKKHLDMHARLSKGSPAEEALKDSCRSLELYGYPSEKEKVARNRKILANSGDDEMPNSQDCDDNTDVANKKKSLICPVCGMFFRRKYCLECHVTKNHNLSVRSPAECNSSKGTNKDKAKEKEDTFKKHPKSHKKIVYKSSGRKLKTKNTGSSANKRRVETSENGPLPTEQPLKCDECGKQFKRECWLNWHVKTCHGVVEENKKSTENHTTYSPLPRKPFQCAYCGIDFLYEKFFRRHSKGRGCRPTKIREKHHSKKLRVGQKEKRLPEPFLKPTSTDKAAKQCDEKKIFECDICKREFIYFGSFEKHLKYHDSSTSEKSKEETAEDYSVTSVQSGFEVKRVTNVCNKSQFETRVCTDSENVVIGFKHKKFSCSECSEQFTHLDDLLKHSSEKHVSYKCPQCEISCSNADELRWHAKTHSRAHSPAENTVKMACKICGQSFSSAHELITHFRTHKRGRKRKIAHSQEEEVHLSLQSTHKTIQETTNSPNNPTCNIEIENAFSQGLEKGTVPNMSDNNDSVVENVTTNNGIRISLYPCSICNKAFNSVKKRLFHMKNAHSSKTRRKKKLSCTICHRRFYKLKTFRQHNRQHRNVPLIWAKTDERELSVIDRNTSHTACERSVEGDGKECNPIDMSFVSEGTVIQEMVSHTSLTSTIDNSRIRGHESSPVGNNKISTNLNESETFKINSVLECVNLKTHSPGNFVGIRFKCSYCSLSFSSIDRRNTHLVTNHKRKTQRAIQEELDSLQQKRKHTKIQTRYTCSPDLEAQKRPESPESTISASTSKVQA